jgi:hypothetical protein
VAAKRHKLARFALFLNLFGGVLLFYSIQLASSKISVVTGTDGSTSLCWENRSFITARPNGSWGMAGPCPTASVRQETAVITTEHPTFIKIGFFFLLVGFFIQFWLEREEPLLPRAERRRQYNLWRKQQKRFK